ncbi:hypothetical protein TRFO_15765 [Tritrichomonas foetus]|uniref:Uncharacterized protein n=1 Tax=Tritrichomonas foetus TaxID=1144522 RepID=A0A1J4KRU5_9EUKA|nr:hypothetical protein TRFO_15765 [Tritrichomonas foetus]|eukprot:OHT13987.1 hypothetical protein TRFO_15765 [Tritrichomonas foetus]
MDLYKPLFPHLKSPIIRTSTSDKVDDYLEFDETQQINVTNQIKIYMDINSTGISNSKSDNTENSDIKYDQIRNIFQYLLIEIPKVAKFRMIPPLFETLLQVLINYPNIFLTSVLDIFIASLKSSKDNINLINSSNFLDFLCPQNNIQIVPKILEIVWTIIKIDQLTYKTLVRDLISQILKDPPFSYASDSYRYILKVASLIPSDILNADETYKTAVTQLAIQFLHFHNFPGSPKLPKNALLLLKRHKIFNNEIINLALELARYEFNYNKLNIYSLWYISESYQCWNEETNIKMILETLIKLLHLNETYQFIELGITIFDRVIQYGFFDISPELLEFFIERIDEGDLGKFFLINLFTFLGKTTQERLCETFLILHQHIDKLIGFLNSLSEDDDQIYGMIASSLLVAIDYENENEI